MESRNEILNELQPLSPMLAAAPRNLPYQAPDGYFGQLPELLLQRVRALEADTAADELTALSPLLAGLSKKTPLSLPEDYFSGLTEQAMAGVQALDVVQSALEQEPVTEDTLPPLLAGLHTRPLYTVPTGYFEAFPERMLQQLRTAGPQSTPARVVSMGGVRKWMRYAAAAVVVGILGLSAWWFLRPADAPAPGNTAMAAAVEKVSDDELLQYLDGESNSALLSYENGAGSDEISSTDMQDLLADVSDEELQQYLDRYNPVRKAYTN
ncbi:MAG: hypothetical protein P0Y53_02815 [Candidatus Pseudobacter hemicellulosilyticus]|uniref:Uncharacterized protein n=1 Tax=Candidatus Pseudobacter hemicellulosilyticus TaxID=3121375 RepID=A0AAJ5WY39_9BACT|nr:MAG: hypothetical protein P0Y53_02815 [Pseudobacter sp.]